MNRTGPSNRELSQPKCRWCWGWETLAWGLSQRFISLSPPTPRSLFRHEFPHCPRPQNFTTTDILHVCFCTVCAAVLSLNIQTANIFSPLLPCLPQNQFSPPPGGVTAPIGKHSLEKGFIHKQHGATWDLWTKKSTQWWDSIFRTILAALWRVGGMRQDPRLPNPKVLPHREQTSSSSSISSHLSPLPHPESLPPWFTGRPAALWAASARGPCETPFGDATSLQHCIWPLPLLQGPATLRNALLCKYRFQDWVFFAHPWMSCTVPGAREGT